MRLYLGNSTKQHREFYFRVPGNDPRGPHNKITIQAGTQIQFPGEHPRVVLDALMEPHLAYGFKEASSVSSVRTFVGMLYSFDKPISESALSYIIDSNDGKLDEMAREELTRTAIASSNMVDLERDGRRRPLAFDAYLEEEGNPKDPGATLAAQGVKVRHDAPPPARGKGRKAA